MVAGYPFCQPPRHLLLYTDDWTLDMATCFCSSPFAVNGLAMGNTHSFHAGELAAGRSSRRIRDLTLQNRFQNPSCGWFLVGVIHDHVAVLWHGRQEYDSGLSDENLPNQTRTPVLFATEVVVMRLWIAAFRVHPGREIFSGLQANLAFSSVADW